MLLATSEFGWRPVQTGRHLCGHRTSLLLPKGVGVPGCVQGGLSPRAALPQPWLEVVEQAQRRSHRVHVFAPKSMCSLGRKADLRVCPSER